MPTSIAKKLNEKQSEELDQRLRAAAAGANIQFRPPKIRLIVRTFVHLLRGVPAD